MDLAAEVDRLWNGNLERQVAEWLKDIEKNLERTRSARKAFHQWQPLRVYVSGTRLMKPGKAAFILRFKGQDVATLTATKGAVELEIDKDYEAANKTFFKFTGVAAGRYPWKSAEARILRDYFKKNANNRALKPRQPEHEVEANIVKDMAKTEGKSKPRALHGLRPVMIENCPLQMPLPISGSLGVPKASKGNIDILARRLGERRRLHLAVWELKKPGVSSTVIDKAIRQAVIYSLVLTKILRSASGPSWYRLFEIKRALPAALQTEAVVVLSSGDIKKFETAWAKNKKLFPIRIGRDEIVSGVAFYDKDTHVVESFQLLV